jgi:Cu2+-exporting ATPase
MTAARLAIVPVARRASTVVVDDREAASIDDPDVAGGFTSWETSADGTRVGRSHVRLAGLWCAGCAGTIEHALKAEPGVVDASASYAAGRATIVWDPAKTKLSTLLAAVRRAGYDAVPDAAAPARALRRAESRTSLWRLFVAAFCMMQVMMYQAPIYFAAPGTLSDDLRTLLLWAAWLLSVPVVVFSAAPIFRDAWRGLRQRRVGMDVPVAIGIALTFVVSSGATFAPHGIFGSEPYFDSLTMFVTFLLAGRTLALRMRHRVADALEAALTRLPSAVRRIDADGTTTMIAPHRLQRGDRVRVLAGEAFPADGPIVEGETDADEALLTGESRPVAKRRGDEAIAGSINLRGAVVQRAERIGADTRYEAIVALMRSALTDRPPLLRAADRVAVPFLWCVLVLAAFAGVAWSWIDPSRAVWVAVSILVVTCPCALSLAAPSALLAAAGRLARRGVLVHRLDAIEAIATIDTVCFDKTGTLTVAAGGGARVELEPAARALGLDEAAVRATAAALAASSTHPLAAALAVATEPRVPTTRFVHVEEHPGFGVEAIDRSGARWRLGSATWASLGSVATNVADGLETWLGDADGVLVARFVFEERLRDGVAASITQLRSEGIDIRLLSGDAAPRVRALAARLGIAAARGGATPADKLAEVAALQGGGCRVAMVGDGLNDAPVMARADVSFAIGDGPALTRSHADVVLMSGSLADVADARAIARRTMRIVRQNLGWAAAYNVVCIPLALVGWLPPWLAGLGMATSSLVVVANSLRVDRRTA